MFKETLMKKKIKYTLSSWGVWPVIDIIRAIPESGRWLVREGCSGNAPQALKRTVLSAYLNRYKVNEFIETGTYLGDTLAYIASNKKIRCVSIELSQTYYNEGVQRFREWENVSIFHGDSGVILPELVNKLKRPALFWLDGHYSGANTAKGQVDSPISIELDSILNAKIKKHVILIDDARLFDGTNGYPDIEDLLRTIRNSTAYDAEISADIIRITPK